MEHPRNYRIKENNLTMLARKGDKKRRMINDQSDGHSTKELSVVPSPIRISSIFFETSWNKKYPCDRWLNAISRF